jgi:alpha-maltose-1-phosphate synthase
MRVAYYARPGQIDTVIARVLAMSRCAEVHLIVETSPEEAAGGMFGPLPNTLRAGAHADAWRSIANWLPPKLESALANVRLHRVVHDSPRALHPRSVAVSVQAARLIRALQPHVVHFDDIWTRSALIVPQLGRCPILASVHDMEAHPGEERPRVHLIRRFAWQYLKHLVFFSRYCQTIYAKQWWLPRVPNTVVPFGILDIYQAWQKHELATEPRSVLFFGRLSAYKGLPVFLAAAPVVARAVPDARFIIAGAPAGDFHLPELATLEHGGRYEILAHYIPNELTCDLFQRASVVALPYISATQSAVLMTAYGFNTPVVASSVGGLPEMVTPAMTGELVPPNDHVALADALIALLRDEPRRAAMEAEIRRRAQDEYSWGRNVEHLLRIYASLSPRGAPVA